MEFAAGFIYENVTTVLVFFVTLLCLILFKNTRREEGVPPGPRRLPIIGNLGSLVGSDTLGILSNLRSKYGDIYGIYIGSELKVFLNGYDIIHDALLKRGTQFSKRPLYEHRIKENDGVVFRNGDGWKEWRAFILTTFRELSSRKSGYTINERITEELTCFVEKLRTMVDTDVDISDLITFSFANVTYNILHGRRIGYDDPKFIWYQNILDEAFREHVRMETLRACFPYLRYFPGDFLSEKKIATTTQELKKYFDEITRQNFENYSPGDENCLIDYWIENSEKSPMFKREKLWIVLHDLMAAGSETTATTLKWIVLALVTYPDIQSKVRQKVDQIIKKNEAPCVADRANLPYVEAIILEALRIGSAVPLSVPHAVFCDTEFHGYKLSKKDTILPNIASVHFDPDIFPEPNVFRPERFLNENETAIVRTEKLIPFSLGPRSCIGETLARIELFMYVTTLVQKFEFLPPENSKPPSLKGVFGLTHRPQNYNVRIRPTV